ncbi:hypothetical protein DV495_000259 [Geotrichum candidum]|nr:hypothetical protein DV452_001620 [Geotrichum candidum]KAF5136003.1 hypothetical protein DV495_000259 [Geotrichum candidum]KAF7499855.1 hypothetical protein DV113_002139 [Geotrichum candidum]KAI8132305.1 hypothetical protein DUD61_004032 [Geotrichum candidum]KAI9213873.1 hypothetical protein DS838_001202 [Geotrichum bryndzae]
MKDSSSSAPQQQTLSSSPSVASSSAASAVPADLPKTVKSKHPSTIELTSALGIPTKARSRRVWTREEDEKLRRLVAHWGDQRGKNSHWDQISAQFEGRTNKDCRKRWFHSLDPTLKRGRWTEDEDRILLEAYGKMGSVWNKIAQLIPGRTDDQCSKRYNDVLDPSVRDRLREWTEEEDEMLLQMVETYGTQWRTISTHMKGRTGLTCRNRWRKIVAPVLPKPGKDKNSISQQQPQPIPNQPGVSSQLKRKRSTSDMGETPESINDIQTSNSIEMEDTVMTDSMGPPLNRSISTPLYPLSNFRANNAGNNNRSSNNGNNSNNNSGTSTSGTSNNGSTNDSSYSDPMSVVGLTRQDDYSPHTQIPESPSTVALLHQVKAASISSSMNHVYKVHNNNSNNNSSNNNNNINTHTSHSNNTATTSSTNYTLSIGNSKDEIHLKNQDLDSLIKLAASMGQQISGHDNEESENGPAAAVNSRTTQHADSGRVVDVTAVVVQPEFRESSVGTTLFKDYIQRLATVGVADRIRVRVPADSSVAEFFERLGFEKRGDKTQDGFLVLENTIEEDDDSMENDQDY